jgi:hypothetical protein
MTRIEKAVRIVSDLYDFYRQIPKIPGKDPVREETPNQKLQRTAKEQTSRSSESPLSNRR